jgi:hypothetical protein
MRTPVHPSVLQSNVQTLEEAKVSDKTSRKDEQNKNLHKEFIDENVPTTRIENVYNALY